MGEGEAPAIGGETGCDVNLANSDDAGLEKGDALEQGQG